LHLAETFAEHRKAVGLLNQLFIARRPTAVSLKALGVEFDATAAAIDARSAAAQAVGYGEGVPPETNRTLVLN